MAEITETTFYQNLMNELAQLTVERKMIFPMIQGCPFELQIKAQVEKLKKYLEEKHKLLKTSERQRRSQEDQEVTFLLEEIALRKWGQHNYLYCFKAHQQLLAHLQQKYGKISSEYLSSIYGITELLHLIREYDLQMRHYEVALTMIRLLCFMHAMNEQKLEELIDLKAEIYEKMAKLSRDQRRYHIAIYCYEKCLEARLGLYGPHHYLTIIAKSNLQRCERMLRLQMFNQRILQLQRLRALHLALYDGESTNASDHTEEYSQQEEEQEEEQEEDQKEEANEEFEVKQEKNKQIRKEANKGEGEKEEQNEKEPEIESREGQRGQRKQIL